MCLNSVKRLTTERCNGTSPESDENLCLPTGGKPWQALEIDTDNNAHTVMFEGGYQIDEYANHSFPNTLWISVPPSEMMMKVSVFIPIVVIGIVGNVAILHVVLRFKHLQSATNLVIANMSLADLISVMICPWTFLINDFFQNYTMGACWCRVEGWLECSLLLVNVMNISVISYDRLTAIVLPQETRLTPRSAKITVALTWAIAFTVCSPLVIYRKLVKRMWNDFLEMYCKEDGQKLLIYWQVLLAMLVWLPLSIMLICYTAIFLKLDRYEQKVMKKENAATVRYKSRVAKVVFMVLLTFIICRTPFTALIFRRNQWLKTNYMNQVVGTDKTLWFVAKYMIYANAAFDPLIYGLTNENFRKVFKTIAFFRILFSGRKAKPAPRRGCNKFQLPKQAAGVAGAAAIGSGKLMVLNVTNFTDRFINSSRECDKAAVLTSTNQTGSKNMLIK